MPAAVSLTSCTRSIDGHCGRCCCDGVGGGSAGGQCRESTWKARGNPSRSEVRVWGGMTECRTLVSQRSGRLSLIAPRTGEAEKFIDHEGCTRQDENNLLTDLPAIAFADSDSPYGKRKLLSKPPIWFPVSYRTTTRSHVPEICRSPAARGGLPLPDAVGRGRRGPTRRCHPRAEASENAA